MDLSSSGSSPDGCANKQETIMDETIRLEKKANIITVSFKDEVHTFDIDKMSTDEIVAALLKLTNKWKPVKENVKV